MTLGIHHEIIPNRPIAFNGQPRCSSASPQHLAENAFRPEAEHPRHMPWASARGQPLPQSIWFQFEKAQFLTKIGFSSRGHVNYQGQTPKSFDVIASADCDQYQVLLHVQDAQLQQPNQAKAWLIPEEGQKGPFRCIGIKIHSVRQRDEKFAALHNMVMWEKRN